MVSNVCRAAVLLLVVVTPITALNGYLRLEDAMCDAGTDVGTIILSTPEQFFKYSTACEPLCGDGCSGFGQVSHLLGVWVSFSSALAARALQRFRTPSPGPSHVAQHGIVLKKILFVCSTNMRTPGAPFPSTNDLNLEGHHASDRILSGMHFAIR
jgi:hypothetical protein